MSNQVWDGTGKVSWPAFAGRLGDMLTDKTGDLESGYRESFRVFSKTASGCIPMEEIKFVLSQVAPEEVSQQSGPTTLSLTSGSDSGGGGDCVRAGQERGRKYQLHRV